MKCFYQPFFWLKRAALRSCPRLATAVRQEQRNLLFSVSSPSDLLPDHCDCTSLFPNFCVQSISPCCEPETVLCQGDFNWFNLLPINKLLIADSGIDVMGTLESVSLGGAVAVWRSKEIKQLHGNIFYYFCIQLVPLPPIALRKTTVIKFSKWRRITDWSDKMETGRLWNSKKSLGHLYCQSHYIAWLHLEYLTICATYTEV